MLEPYHFEPEYNEDDERESASDGEFTSDQESDQLDRMQSNDWCICLRLHLLPSKEEGSKCSEHR